MGEKSRQVVVELLIDEPEVMLKVSSKLLHVVEDLLEILLNHRQDPRELYVTHARHYVVGDGMVLVTD